MNIDLSQVTNSREDKIKRRQLISTWVSKNYPNAFDDLARARISFMSNEYVRNVNMGLASSTWHGFEVWLNEYIAPPENTLYRPNIGN